MPGKELQRKPGGGTDGQGELSQEVAHRLGGSSSFPAELGLAVRRRQKGSALGSSCQFQTVLPRGTERQG